MNYPRLQTTFLGCSKNLMEIYYAAAQVKSGHKYPISLWHNIQKGIISKESIRNYLTPSQQKRCSGHLSQVQFIFVVSGISRLSSDFLKCQHLSVETVEKQTQPSDYNVQDIEFIPPPHIRENPKLAGQWEKISHTLIGLIKDCQNAGIPSHEIDLIMPQGTITQDLISMSFQKMQHFMDFGLCEFVEGELNRLSWQIYEHMKVEFPTLAKRLGIKCWENRNLFCDEVIEHYKKCKWCSTRPHISEFNQIWKTSSESSPQNVRKPTVARYSHS